MKMALQRISENIVYLPKDDTTDRPILAAISGTKKTLLIDAGASPAHVELFQSELKRHHINRGDYVAITHWHWDHTFGMSALNLPIIAHVETRKHLKKMMSYGWTDEAIDMRVQEGIEIPFCADMIKKEFTNRNEITITLPDIVFEKRLLIDLGGLHCIIEHVGGDHSNDNSIIYVEEDRMLFLGDCLGPSIYTGKWCYQSKQVLALLAKIQSYNAETYLESHWKPVTRAEFTQETKIMRVVASCIKDCDGDKNILIAETTKRLGRQLNEADLETITYFINGLSILGM